MKGGSRWIPRGHFPPSPQHALGPSRGTSRQGFTPATRKTWNGGWRTVIGSPLSVHFQEPPSEQARCLAVAYHRRERVHARLPRRVHFQLRNSSEGPRLMPTPDTLWWETRGAFPLSLGSSVNCAVLSDCAPYTRLSKLWISSTPCTRRSCNRVSGERLSGHCGDRPLLPRQIWWHSSGNW